MSAGLLAIGLAVAPVQLVRGAVTCASWAQGTLADDGTWTAGAASSDTDARTVCTSNTVNDTLRFTDLEAASNYPDPATTDRLVIDVSDSGIGYVDLRLDDNEDGEMIVTGALGGSGKNAIRYILSDLEPGQEDEYFKFTSLATISASGTENRGIYARNMDTGHRGRLEWTNGGAITTTGNLGHGLDVRSDAESAKAEARAVNKGAITTSGSGARGVYAKIEAGSGTATAINEATVATSGDHLYVDDDFTNPDNPYFVGSDGVRAWNPGDGDAVATNESGASITVRGSAARGLTAQTERGGTALATNRGAVTAEGETGVEEDVYRSSAGVYALSVGGLARAVNERGATVTTGKRDAATGTITGGERAYGVFAGNREHTGRAEAVNRGTITTYGDVLSQGPSEGSKALEAWSQHNSAYAENSGEIATWGRRAHGVNASSEGGGQDESAVAVNSGTVTVKGDFHGDGAFGVLAASRGGAHTRAVNTPSGRIVSEGDGGYAMLASARSNAGGGASGDSTAVNRGAITVTGDVALYDSTGDGANDRWRTSTGQVAYAMDGAATTVNEGSIRTEGQVSYGAAAYSRTGRVSVINRGRIVTTGGSSSTLPGQGGNAQGSRGINASSGSGDAVLLNDVSGHVETSGQRAFAMIAEIENDGGARSASVEIRNRGRVVTTGSNADAMVAQARPGGTADNPNQVRVFNEAGASVSTAGDGSGAMNGSIQVNAGNPSGGADAYGSILVRNDGTVSTSGGHGSAGFDVDNAAGLGGTFYSTDGTAINNSGDVTLHNTGSVTVTGPRARGMQAVAFGSGKATVIVDGGSVTASHNSTTDDSLDGIGIFASSGSGGVEATIRNGATITAPKALELDGPATVRLLDSTLDGLVTFGDAADRFTINDGIVRGKIAMGGGDDRVVFEDNGYVAGDIDFGAGVDRLDLDVFQSFNTSAAVVISGNISRLEEFYKRGKGGALIRDASFSGSSATIEDGTLLIQGNFDLGQHGTLTVHEQGRLSVLATTGDDDEVVLPTITAGGGVSAENGSGSQTDVTVYLQNDGETLATAEQMTDGLWGAGTTFSGDRIRYRTDAGSNGESDLGGAEIGADGAPGEASVSGTPAQIQVEPLVTPPSNGGSGGGGSTGGGSTGGGSGGGGAAGVLVGGGVLALLLSFLDFGPAATLPAPGVEPRPGFARAQLGESQFWTRDLGQSAVVPASGVELGMDVALGGGFALGVAMAPEVSARREDGSGATGLSGGRYGLQASWRDEGLFAGFGLTRADWRADAAFENRALGGMLRGRFDAEQTDLRLGAGFRVALGGGVTLTPSAELFAGEIEQAGYRAAGPVFRAAMPEVTQRYRGWKAGLALASDWREGPQGLKLRPALKLTAMRARASSGSFMLEQSDSLGLVTTSNRARLAGAPRTAIGLGAGLEATDGEGFSVRFGYAGAIIDGEQNHALVAGLKLRF